MRDARLLQAFFAVLEGDGVRIGVEDQARMRVLFATRNEWDLTTVRVALRSLLIHDPHRRASFDRHFSTFFAGMENDQPTYSAGQLGRVLDDLRNLRPDAAEQTRVQGLTDGTEEDDQTPKRHNWRKRVREICRSPRFVVTGILAVVIGVGGWILRDRPEPLVSTPETPVSTPETPVSTPETPVSTPEPPKSTSEPPAFTPTSLAFEPPVEGDRTTKTVSLTNPDDETTYDIESLTAVGGTDEETVELSLEHASLPHRLPPGDEFKIAVTAKARQWDSWTGSVEADILEVPDPVVLSISAWKSDPWRDLPVGVQLDISTRPTNSDLRWIGWLIAVFANLAGGVGYYAWLSRRRHLDLRPIADPELDAPGKGFSIATIGGSRQPVVRQKRARRLADMLGHVRTGDFTHRLDLPRTVERAIRAGGFPELAWQFDKITRRVLILEDALIDPDCHTGVINDLQQGLERTGVEVERAWFRGGVGRFANVRGVERELRELHAWRQLYVVLVYTDGSGFARRADQQTLLSLTDWPAVAVLDPRDPTCWDEAADPLAGSALPRYRANETGVRRAFRSFVNPGHRCAAGDRQLERHVRRAHPVLSGDPERQIAAALGDSLLWAASCVWLQPCSLALAEALREEFHPHLPADRLQRILKLPDTRSDPDGFRFGTRSRNALRAIWTRRQSDQERKEVLDFIADRVDETEPEEPRSTAHLVWEAIRERYRLEAIPGHSPRRLAELARSAANPYVQESLHDFRVGPGPRDDERTVLETNRDDPKSRQYLASICQQLDTPFLSRLPLERGQRVCLGALVTLASVCLLGLFWTVLNPIREYWDVVGASSPHTAAGSPSHDGSEGEYELWEDIAGRESKRLGIWEQGWTATQPIPTKDATYRVVYQRQTNLLETPNFKYDSGQVASISTSATTRPPGEQPAWRKFAWIPPGQFQMGSPETEPGRDFDDEQQHTVTLSRGFWLAATEVTEQQWEQVMGTSIKEQAESGIGGINGARPISSVFDVSWEDARKFCENLTKQEHDARQLPDEWEFRLPTEAQWEYACRAGSEQAYSFGDDENQLPKYAWFAENSGGRIHAVGLKRPNDWGLYDMHGNVWEWCWDWYDAYPETEPEIDPAGPGSGLARVARGGSWNFLAVYCRSANRSRYPPELRNKFLGFRVAAVRVEPKPGQASPRDEGERAIEICKLEFVRLPPGEFVMGSPADEQGRSRDESPRHRVKISRPFYIGRYEVTQQQWKQVMETSLQEQAENGVGGIYGEGPSHPMYHVSWSEAIEFCDKLTEQYRQAGVLPNGYVYTLPTEAQWEYACRADSERAYCFGDDESQLPEYAWFDVNSEATTHVVGQKQPNDWGLYDMHGNLWEWCWDWYGPYPETEPEIDPAGPGTGQDRVVRGGCWDGIAQFCRSALRGRRRPGSRYYYLGFRVAAVREDEVNARRGR